MTRTREEVKADMDRVRASVLQTQRDHVDGCATYDELMDRVRAYRTLLLEYRRTTGKKIYIPNVERLRAMMTQVPG